MEKEINELLEQLDNTRKDTRVIDREKANNYYNAIINLQTQLKKQKEIIDKAIEYINNNLRQDMLSDFTGASYIQEYMCEPDELLQILEDKEV